MANNRFTNTQKNAPRSARANEPTLRAPKNASTIAERRSTIQRAQRRAQAPAPRPPRPAPPLPQLPNQTSAPENPASEAARRARFQTNVMQAQANQASQPPEPPEEEPAEEPEVEEMPAQTQESDGALQQGSEKIADAQNTGQQAAKKIVPKAANWLASFLSSALDLGTAGASFLVTVFIYMITLGWLNVQMIYGSWIAKGKSSFIAPLSWDPIPMPIDKKGIILQGLVIMADLIFITMLVLFISIGILILLAIFSPLLILNTFGSEILSQFL